MTTICVFVSTTVAILCLTAGTAFAKDGEETKPNPSPVESVTAKVDKLFAEWNKADSPGCSIAISKNGVVVYERGYGMANLESGAAITPESVFHVASISKQFTAMSILLLAQRGKLSLDDEARKYITELPDYGTPLTIRHLLTHTSGLRDAFLLQGMAAPREDDADKNDAIVKTLSRQRALNSRPGTEFQYNNGGYVLLGVIVKRVSGQSLRAFTESNIFKPLGMTRTRFHDDPTEIVPNRTSGYHRDGNTVHLAMRADPGGLVGNAGLFTTVGDLLLWEQNFADLRVGDKELVAAMQKPAIPTDWGDGISYGFGLAIGQHRGLRTVGHGGGDPGYGAYLVRYPDQGFAVAVLCNLDNPGNLTTLTQDIADIYLADAFPTASATNTTVAPPKLSLSAEQLASKAGLYRDPSTEIVGRFFVRDGKLRASTDDTEGESFEMIPISTNRFIIPGTTVAVEFVPTANGRSQEARVTGARPKPIVSQKLEPFVPSSADLGGFAGQYTSPEIDVTYTIIARESNLVVQMPGRPDAPLRPIFPDAFAGLNVLKFSRNPNGAITGFSVYATGARGVRFDRVKQ